MKKESGEQHTLDAIKEEKDLGITIDANLTFKTHIMNSVNKANQMLGIIKRTFTCINKDVFIPLYKGMIRPHVEYGSCIWSPSMQYLKIAVENVQRRATRLLPEMKNKTYEERLISLNLPSLCYRRRRSDIIQTFKILHDRDHIKQGFSCGVNQMFEPSKAHTTRGHNQKKQIQHAVGVRSKYFTTRVTSAWNNLPSKAVTAPTVNHLKNILAKASTEKALMYSLLTHAQSTVSCAISIFITRLNGYKLMDIGELSVSYIWR